MNTPQPSPPITDALRAEARANPGSWIYAVDPVFEGAPDVPPQGIVGAWQAGPTGDLSQEFTPNPNYVPSPVARGWARPASALENTLQIVLSGHAPHELLVSEFASAPVFIFGRPEGGIFLAPSRDGDRLAYAFTDAAKATAAGHAESSTISGADLAAALPEGVRIALNPGSEISEILDPVEITGA